MSERFPRHNKSGETLNDFSKYCDIFATNDDELGHTTIVQDEIPTVDDVPINERFWHIPPSQLQEVKEDLESLLRKGVIVESHSNYASPIVLARRKTGALRMCINYRMLNVKSRRDVHPLPRIINSIESLSNASWFSSLDLQSADIQVDMAEKDARKTAFTTPYGLFQYTRMPFGLSNCLATFQRLMLKIFCDEMFVILLVYLDERRYIGIFSGSGSFAPRTFAPSTFAPLRTFASPDICPHGHLPPGHLPPISLYR